MVRSSHHDRSCEGLAVAQLTAHRMAGNRNPARAERMGHRTSVMGPWLAPAAPFTTDDAGRGAAAAVDATRPAGPGDSVATELVSIRSTIPTTAVGAAPSADWGPTARDRASRFHVRTRAPARRAKPAAASPAAWPDKSAAKTRGPSGRCIRSASRQPTRSPRVLRAALHCA